jgi:hypothetical protein
MSYNTELQANIADLREILDKVNALPEAGGDAPAEPVLQDKTVTPTTSVQTVTADAGYDGLDTVTVEAMPTAVQATPSISVDANGKITASATQTAGYVEAGTKSATKQLTTQAAKTITPTKSSQTAVAKNVYTTGAITVRAIPGEYITTTDATASADKIMSGETAYVNGSKITGTFSIDSELSAQDSLIAQIRSVADSLPDAGGGGLATCTVDISSSSRTIGSVIYTTVEDNMPVAKYIVVNASQVIITALQGSAIILSVDNLTMQDLSGVDRLNSSGSGMNIFGDFTNRTYKVLYEETGSIVIR